MTKEDMEDGSGEGEKECWLGEKKDTMNRARRRVGVREIAAGVNPLTWINPDQN